MVEEREYDLVLYGATSFVGRLIAAHLAGHAPPGARIALAGRSKSRLEATRAQLPAPASDWPLLVADAADADAVARMVASTTALATTVGPYAKYGMPVVEACATAGTHYADLTGEIQFARAAIDRTDGPARATRARIVHSCGYDSIPSDLGVLMLHQRAAEDGNGDLGEVTMVAAARGGLSGGTFDSLRGEVDAARADPEKARVARDPYSLSPDRDAEPQPDQPSDFPKPERHGGMWTAPFVMAPYNTRIVRRSNALSGYAYGRQLRYRELMACGSHPLGAVAATVVRAGLGAMAGAMSNGITRPVVDRVLPAPGQGPSEKRRRAGWFRSDFDALTASGERYRATISGRGDPGYNATAVMFGESALCLALDGDRLPERAGSLTPATAMGAVLIERLRAAGHNYVVSRA
jgi:short subunit dehydrogenase-like uncharacterized protein